MMQLDLPIAQAESEAAAKAALIRQRCELIEAVLRGIGYDSGHAIWRVATYLARVAGWETWSGTYERIATDNAVGCHVGTVRRVVRELQSLGLANVAKLMRAKRGCVGVEIRLDNVAAVKRIKGEHQTAQKIIEQKPIAAATPIQKEERHTAAKPAGDWNAAAEAVKLTGLERVPVAIREARAAGWSPLDLIEASIVVRCNESLKPGALIARIRDGCWPAGRVREYAELASAAERIRDAVISEAAERDQPPPPWLVSAVVARRLKAAGLAGLATPAESHAAAKYEQKNATVRT